MYVIPAAILDAMLDFYSKHHDNLIVYASIDCIGTESTKIDI